MSLSPRDRVEKTIRFETPDRLPFNFWMDRRRMAQLEEQYGENFRVTHYDADVVESLAFLPFPTAEFKDQSGTEWMVKPLFEDWTEMRDLELPDPDNSGIVAIVENDLKHFSDRAVLADFPNVLTFTERMINQQKLYMDMCLAPDLVQEFFHRMSDIMASVAERICKLDITALYVMDDIGFNNGLMISPEQLRDQVLPHWKKVIDVAHAHDKPVFFHTDGKVEAAWHIFADELGVRMLNPLQPNLQSVSDFKAIYHGKMGVYGGLDTARIHTMTPDEIRAHVLDLFEKAGAGGGLIASTHDLDISITDCQLDALVGAIKECTY